LSILEQDQYPSNKGHQGWKESEFDLKSLMEMSPC